MLRFKATPTFKLHLVQKNQRWVCKYNSRLTFATPSITLALTESCREDAIAWAAGCRVLDAAV